MSQTLRIGSDSISRISDGDSEEVTIPLEVASDADTGDVEVLISVDGEDESASGTTGYTAPGMSAYVQAIAKAVK